MLKPKIEAVPHIVARGRGTAERAGKADFQGVCRHGWRCQAYQADKAAGHVRISRMSPPRAARCSCRVTTNYGWHDKTACLRSACVAAFIRRRWRCSGQIGVWGVFQASPARGRVGDYFFGRFLDDHLSVIRQNRCVWAPARYIWPYDSSAFRLSRAFPRLVRTCPSLFVDFLRKHGTRKFFSREFS